MNDLEGYLKPEQIDKTLLGTIGMPRNWMLIYMAWHTGRRISEILQVQKKHIDFEKETIIFHILKKKNKDFQKIKAIDNELLTKLKTYTEYLKPEDYLFPSPYNQNQPLSRQQAYNIIRKAMEAAEIMYVGTKKPHPHVLRHSFAINFMQRSSNQGVALKLLSELLEHSKLEMTSVYLQFGQQDIKNELNKIFKKP